MRFLLATIVFLSGTSAMSEDIVIAFPVDPNSIENPNQENVFGFVIIESGEEQGSLITASEHVVEAARGLKKTVDFVGDAAASYEAVGIDLNAYASEDATVRQYLVRVPDRFPGDDQYPGGGGGWWPPRVIWPPQGGAGGIEATAGPKPWPGGGGGWWPPRAAALADTSENDVLRGIFINTESYSGAVQGGSIPLVIME